MIGNIIEFSHRHEGQDHLVKIKGRVVDAYNHVIGSKSYRVYKVLIVTKYSFQEDAQSFYDVSDRMVNRIIKFHNENENTSHERQEK